MKRDHNEYVPHDKQLRSVSLEAVLSKRRLSQALNAKEFAVSAGISYSTARSWFHLPGFPAFHGVVFWEDFVAWRQRSCVAADGQMNSSRADKIDPAAQLPPRAASILHDGR